MIFIIIILLIISLMLESAVPNLLKNIIPFFIIATILISSSFKINKKNFYVLLFITGFIYDLLYTDALILHSFIYLFIGYLSKLILSHDASFFKYIFYYYLLSLTYVLILFLITYVYVPHNIINLIFKLRDSLIINTLYFCVLYLIFIGIKRISCNRNKKYSYF